MDAIYFFDVIVTALVDFYHSPFVLAVKIMIGIYLAVLIIDIILLLILRNVSWHLRVGIKGSDMPLISKSKMQKRWDKVKERMKSDSESQYKVAIIEADAIAEEVLDGIGYGGHNMLQRLEQAEEIHLDEHKEKLIEVHQIRNRIVHETDFEISKENALLAIKVYEDFLKYLEFLD